MDKPKRFYRKEPVSRIFAGSYIATPGDQPDKKVLKVVIRDVGTVRAKIVIYFAQGELICDPEQRWYVRDASYENTEPIRMRGEPTVKWWPLGRLTRRAGR